jgi:hypothetical protein
MMKKELVVVFVRLFRNSSDAVVQWLANVEGDGRCVVRFHLRIRHNLSTVVLIFCLD